MFLSLTLIGEIAALADPLVNIPTNLSGTPGSTVTAPINIDNAEGLEAADLTFSYDSALLDVLAVRTGTVTSGGTLITNPNPVTAATGTIQISLAMTTPRPAGGGSLLEVDFQIKSTAGPVTTPVNLQSVSLNEGGLVLTPPVLIGADSNDGLITILSGNPTITVADVQVAEGNTGVTTAAFTVSLSETSGQAITVDYIAADGTAQGGSDFTAVPLTTLTFNPGETTKDITVNVLGDTTVELNETFQVLLSNPVGATIADGSGQGTILNDDAATLRINDVSVTEGDSGTSAAVFSLSVANPSAAS